MIKKAESVQLRACPRQVPDRLSSGAYDLGAGAVLLGPSTPAMVADAASLRSGMAARCRRLQQEDALSPPRLDKSWLRHVFLLRYQSAALQHHGHGGPGSCHGMEHDSPLQSLPLNMARYWSRYRL